MALVCKTNRSATIRCVEPMNTLSLPKREFQVLASSIPQLRQSLEQITEKRRQENITAEIEIENSEATG